jgi:hypothetical protein
MGTQHSEQPNSTPVDQQLTTANENPTKKSEDIAWPSLASAWPAPISGDAFCGLAGEIVRTIEPHTESDPVALFTPRANTYRCGEWLWQSFRMGLREAVQGTAGRRPPARLRL